MTVEETKSRAARILKSMEEVQIERRAGLQEKADRQGGRFREVLDELRAIEAYHAKGPDR